MKRIAPSALVLAALVLAGVVAVATGRWSARGSTASVLRAE